ncbi:acyl-CoA dehydrogenase family protein [Dactylosporangium sp. NPDC005572]|uniref:acyl-CoA dehydrogenase family protein n=1 Tax=Dactylosporangium sp. NPDC005572 TaxID=3156889 RepID=UPI0033A1EB1F
MDDRKLRAEVRAFAVRTMAALGLRPRCDSWMVSHSPEFSRALAARGWVGMTMPSEYGGHDRSFLERYVVNEELLALGAPVAAHWFADRQVGPSVLRHGTEEQRRRYLPGIAAAERYFAIGMSEADSGSDLAAVRTRATEVPGGWRLSGAKIWTSHAHRAHSILVLARTDPPAERRHTGLSQFLVDLDLDGVEVRPIATMDGEHHFNEVVFHDVLLGEDALLGARGRGWEQVTAELAYERSGPERFLSTMPLLRALMREADCAGPAVGSLLAELRSVRVLSYQVAQMLDQGRVPTVRSALVKDLGTQLERRVVEVACSLAPVRPDPHSADELPRLLGEALLHNPDRTLRGGTNEILRGIVARDLVGSSAGRLVP